MSFSDLMSSARGPGVIGMLLALVVLVGFGVLFVFAFDEGLQGKPQTLKSVIAGQVLEIDRLKESLDHSAKQLEMAPGRLAAAKNLRELGRENGDRGAMIESLNQGISKYSDEIAAKMETFEAYKNEYRAFVRGNAKDQKMDQLETSGGNVYKNVAIREVTAVGMQIRHDGGFRRIPFEELPEEIRDFYQFDPDQKAAELAKELETRNLHEDAVSVAKDAAKEKAEEQRERMKEAERAETIRSIAVGEAKLKTLGDQIKALETAIPQEALKRISNVPQMRRQLATKQSQYNSLQAELVRMRAGL